jgi:cytochrome c-type biogenesis protein CcmE
VKPKYKRSVFVGIGLCLLAFAVFLVLSAIEDTVVFFQSPTEVLAGEASAQRRIRLGGLVEAGSVEQRSGAQTHFRVTDLTTAVPVTFTGVLPDLFREGQGVVVEGRLQDGIFVADQVLAKHDENYMPPEVADALKQSGHWQQMKERMQQAGQSPGSKTP